MKKLFTIFTILLIIISTPLDFPKAIEEKKIDKGEYIIFIDINELTLSLLDKNTKKTIKKYPVAIGKKSTPSPIGQWQIISKALKKGPFGGYWLGLNAPWDTFGIHGTNNPSSIGSMASNGCIRMYNHDIIEIFNAVSYDTQVIVYPGPSWLFSPYDRTIKKGDKGADVFYVQKALRNLGYFSGVPDGIYGYSLEIAVTSYKEEHNMKVNTDIDKEFLDAIGLIKFE